MFLLGFQTYAIVLYFIIIIIIIIILLHMENISLG